MPVELTKEQIMAREAEEARQQAAEAARAELLADTVSKMTYAQIEYYIDANVTDLASARGFLKKLTKVVKALVDR